MPVAIDPAIVVAAAVAAAVSCSLAADVTEDTWARHPAPEEHSRVTMVINGRNKLGSGPAALTLPALEVFQLTPTPSRQCESIRDKQWSKIVNNDHDDNDNDNQQQKQQRLGDLLGEL